MRSCFTVSAVGFDRRISARTILIRPNGTRPALAHEAVERREGHAVRLQTWLCFPQVMRAIFRQLRRSAAAAHIVRHPRTLIHVVLLPSHGSHTGRRRDSARLLAPILIAKIVRLQSGWWHGDACSVDVAARCLGVGVFALAGARGRRGGEVVGSLGVGRLVGGGAREGVHICGERQE